MSVAPPSFISFPSSDEPQQHARPRPLPHLPFRRISLPTAPSLMKRESVASVASFDSMPEDAVPTAPHKLDISPRKPKTRPISMEPARKSKRAARHGQSFDRTESKDNYVTVEAKRSKRCKVILEFFDTERAYVNGLELIYSFLTPILVSLDTSTPLLQRPQLTAIFSNFIDIWNLHRSFVSSLSTLLAGHAENPPALSPLLLSHFPYLSLYTPFVTSFPSLMTALEQSVTPSTTPFAIFLARQEAEPRCGKLKLRDWLLTIVQRCPRYLLLLKDLIGCTDGMDGEHAQLSSVHTLVSKITLSLNTSLHTHAQTMSLLAIQKSTPNLPFQLITPGRTLLRRGRLFQLERSELPASREFLLFNDCMIWLSGGVEPAWDLKQLGRPGMIRTRSKSEAELPVLQTRRKQMASGSVVEERWTYKGKVELVDLEVIVMPPREEGEERRFEILSPGGSFALYASHEDERDEWTSAIRLAKSALLASLNVTHPQSTLTSSSSTAHLRRSLQALPFAPTDERLGSVMEHGKGVVREKRGRVEHWIPAIWIPDAKTEGCMRCGKSFGWRRRRHHCRLCGRCVCASCSARTFFITDSNAKGSTKSARACDACYETVFPLLDPSAAPAPLAPEQSPSSLSGLPTWLSIPSLVASSQPETLMSIDEDDDPHSREVRRVRMKSPSRHDLDDPPSPRNKEDTQRRSKRFSMPALALHTTSVTARTGEEPQRSKRLSLVLGGRSHGNGAGPADVTESQLGQGLAASRLTEILGRKKS